MSPDFSFPYTLLRNEECEEVIKDGEEGGEGLPLRTGIVGRGEERADPLGGGGKSGGKGRERNALGGGEKSGREGTTL